MNRFEILTNKPESMLNEIWVCNACGVPCRVEIQYEKTEYKHLEKVPRFFGGCICGNKAGRESLFPEWVQVR